MKRSNRPALQLAPTADQFDAYNTGLSVRNRVLGLQYQTGPRRGQQLAATRKDARP